MANKKQNNIVSKYDHFNELKKDFYLFLSLTFVSIASASSALICEYFKIEQDPKFKSFMSIFFLMMSVILFLNICGEIYKMFIGKYEFSRANLISIQTKRIDYYYVTEINYEYGSDEDTIYIDQRIYTTLREPVIEFY
jgi:hypothetical protein